MDDKKIEFSAGLFVLIGLVLIGFLAFRIGDTHLFTGGQYKLFARFADVGGLTEGSKVRVAGVSVGTVGAIRLDRETYYAMVELQLAPDIQLDDDTIASVKTNGLIGDKYISLLPGGSGIPLEDGDTIIDTESAVDFEGLVSKIAFGEVEE